MEENKENVEVESNDNEEIVIEEVNVEEDDSFVESDDNDDEEFLKSLEEIGEGEEEQEEQEEVDEIQKIKNKNAEEARKRREAEAKAKKQKEEEEQKKKQEEVSNEGDEESKREEVNQEEEQEGKSDVNELTPQEQVKQLVEKHPEVDLAQLDNDKDFQEYIQGKWHKGGKTIAELYESYVDFEARVSKKEKAEVESKFVKKPGPSIKGSSGGGGSNSKVEDVFTPQEMEVYIKRMPFMKPSEYEKIEQKLERSAKYYKNQK